jgi:hypothetical protein
MLGRSVSGHRKQSAAVAPKNKRFCNDQSAWGLNKETNRLGERWTLGEIMHIPSFLLGVMMAFTPSLLIVAWLAWKAPVIDWMD